MGLSIMRFWPFSRRSNQDDNQVENEEIRFLDIDEDLIVSYRVSMSEDNSDTKERTTKSSSDLMVAAKILSSDAIKFLELHPTKESEELQDRFQTLINAIEGVEEYDCE